MTSGRPKASVLPDPVGACPQMSRPDERIGNGRRLNRQRAGNSEASRGAGKGQGQPLGRGRKKCRKLRSSWKKANSGCEFERATPANVPSSNADIPTQSVAASQVATRESTSRRSPTPRGEPCRVVGLTSTARESVEGFRTSMSSARSFQNLRSVDIALGHTNRTRPALGRPRAGPSRCLRRRRSMTPSGVDPSDPAAAKGFDRLLRLTRYPRIGRSSRHCILPNLEPATTTSPDSSRNLLPVNRLRRSLSKGDRQDLPWFWLSMFPRVRRSAPLVAD